MLLIRHGEHALLLNALEELVLVRVRVVEEYRFLVVLFACPGLVLRTKDGSGVDVIEVARGVAPGYSCILVGQSGVSGPIVVFEDPVILTGGLDLRLLFNRQIVLVIELRRQEAELVRRLQARRQQIQEVQVVLQEVLLVGQSPDLADIIFIAIQTLKHIIFI